MFFCFRLPIFKEYDVNQKKHLIGIFKGGKGNNILFINRYFIPLFPSSFPTSPHLTNEYHLDLLSRNANLRHKEGNASPTSLGPCCGSKWFSTNSSLSLLSIRNASTFSHPHLHTLQISIWMWYTYTLCVRTYVYRKTMPHTHTRTHGMGLQYLTK